MYCKKCGAELSDDAEFCPVCRSSVGGTEQEAVSSAVPPAPELSTTPSAPEPLEPEDYSAGAAVPMFTEPEKKPRKLNLTISVVIAVVFGFLSMFVCQTAAGLCAASGALSSHAVSGQIADIDIGSIKIGGIIPDNIKEQFGTAASDISDDIAGIVSKISDGAMTAEQAAEVIKKADISREIAKIVQSYEDFIMSGRSDIDLSAELQRIITGAKQVYKEVTGKDAPASFDSDVAAALKENAETLRQAAPQAALGVMGDTMRVIFSPAVWIAAFVISALFPLLAGLISRRVPVGLMCGGAAYFVSGVGILISDLLNGILMNSLMSARNDELGNVISDVISNALNGRLTVCGAALAAVGAALIIAFIIVKVSDSRKKKTA